MAAKDWGRVALLVLGAFALHLTGFASFLIGLPLLSVQKRYPKAVADTACVAALVLVLGREISAFAGTLNQALTWAFILVNMFIPASLTLCACAWANRKGDAGTATKTVATILPVPVLYLAYLAVFLFWEEGRDAVVAAYSDAAGSALGVLYGAELADAPGFTLAIVLTLFTVAPMLVTASHLGVVFLHSAVGRRGDQDFEFKVAAYKLPEWFLYIFLALWALVLVTVIAPCPVWLVMPVLGFAVTTLVFYFIQGIAIVLWNMRARGSRVQAFGLASLIALLMLLAPGLNALLGIALTLLGVLDNWLRLRKPKEFSNEDHS